MEKCLGKGIFPLISEAGHPYNNIRLESAQVVRKYMAIKFPPLCPGMVFERDKFQMRQATADFFITKTTGDANQVALIRRNLSECSDKIMSNRYPSSTPESMSQ